MAWIESHQGLARHIKTKRLARRLKVSIPTTIGHLHLLWWWAMDNLPDGRLTALEPEDIADEMMWTGDAADLLEALKETGFVDQVENDLYIHDWHDYIGRLLERRKKETDRKREYRSKSQSCPAGQPTDETRDGGGNSTVPYLTEPKDIKSKKRVVVSSETDVVVKVIEYLNNATGKNFGTKTKETLKLINGRLREGRTFEDFKYVIDVKTEEWLYDEKMREYLNPGTLFNQSKFEKYINQKNKKAKPIVQLVQTEREDDPYLEEAYAKRMGK